MKKKYLFTTAIALILAGVIIIIVAVTHQPAKPPVVDGETPSYAVIVPKNSSVAWQRVSPSSSAPVYAYADTISGVEATISEQPLPTSFQSDPSGQIANLAQGYNATDTITAGGTKVYIGTSANGPQSVIFTKNKLLVLIKSQATISDKAWAAYINSLSAASGTE